MWILPDRILSSTGKSRLTGIWPNKFVLVKFGTRSNTREVTVSLANACGAQTGVMDGRCEINVEKLQPSAHRVIPQEDQAGGDPGFYNGGGAGPSGGAKLFVSADCLASSAT
jgi:hypothetical protein